MRPFGVRGAFVLAALAGCAPAGQEPLGESQEAINVCDETVPSDRYVDGLPAYQQCDTTTGSIWSNDGVDTATSSQGSDWVRTQQGGGYQCTEWAWRYMHFRWGIDYRHGDAREWCAGTLPSTLVMSTTPVHGDLIVFDAGVCGADGTTGHIAVIDTVDGARAKVTIVEENRAGRRATDQSCALCFLHAVPNDGSTTGSGGAPAAGAGGMPARAGAGSGGAPGVGGRPAGASGGAAGAGGAETAAGGAFAGGGAHAAGAGGGPGAAGSTSVGGGSGADGRAGATGTEAGGSGGSATSSAGAGGTGAGGQPNTAGASPSGSGAGPTAGSPANAVTLTPGDTSASGGCNVSARGSASNGAWLWLLGLWLVSRRRREKSRPLAA